jgi:hypothetical protein
LEAEGKGLTRTLMNPKKQHKIRIDESRQMEINFASSIRLKITSSKCASHEGNPLRLIT